MKTVYHLYLPTALEPSIGELDWPERPDFGAMKSPITKLLNSGAEPADFNFEHVAVLYHGERRDMFVDELGRYKNNLDINLAATFIYLTNTVLHQKRGTFFQALETGSFIVGPALLFERRVWF